MAQNQISNTNINREIGNVADVLKDSLAVAMGNVVHALEPQLNEFATRYAAEAVDRSRAMATRAVRSISARPWYLVGVAAVLLVGAAVVIGLQSAPNRKEIMH